SAAGVSQSTRASSEEFGSRLGVAVIAWSRQDGFDATRGRAYAPPRGLAMWYNDAPLNTFAAQNLSGASEFVAVDNPANVLQSGGASDRGLILNRPKKTVVTLPAVNMTGASEPYWGSVRPFALKAWNECPVATPPGYGTDSSSVL